MQNHFGEAGDPPAFARRSIFRAAQKALQLVHRQRQVDRHQLRQRARRRLLCARKRAGGLVARAEAAQLVKYARLKRRSPAARGAAGPIDVPMDKMYVRV